MSRRIVQWLCVCVAAMFWVNIAAAASEQDLVHVLWQGFWFAVEVFTYVGWIHPWIERQA